MNVVSPGPCLVVSLSSSEISGYLNFSPAMLFPADSNVAFSRNLQNFQVPDLTLGWLILILFCTINLAYFQNFSSVVL